MCHVCAGKGGTCRAEVTPDGLNSLDVETKTLGVMTGDIAGQGRNLP